MRTLLTVFALAIATAGSVTAQGTPSTSLDRTHAPAIPAAKPLTFPKAQQRTLKNGIPIIILEDHTRPVVSVSTVVRISSLAEPVGKTRINGFVAGLMGEGTTKHTADQLANEFAALGNHVSPTGFYTIPANVDKSLELMAEQFLSPSFPQAELDLQKTQLSARLERAKESPGYIAGRILGKNLYGADHPYTREVTPEDIRSITRDDIVKFYNEYYRPPNIKVVVAGDITPDQAVSKLNRVFGDLTPGKQGDLPVPPVTQAAKATTVYLYDRPGSPQSIIIAAQLGPRRDSPDQYAIELMNTALGGAFNSRLNLNLREQHQYAYGANAGFNFRRPPEPSTFTASAAVATAKTDSALIEVMKEINGIRTTKPVSAEELDFAKASATKSLPLQFETIGQRAGAVAGLVASDQPLDYYNTIIQKYNGVTLAQAQAAAQKYLAPDKMVIVVVGDRKAVEAGLRAANLGPVVVVDTL
jgi:zinc protease